MSSSYDSSSIESFNIKNKLKSAVSTTSQTLKSAANTTSSGIKSAASTTGSGIKKGGSAFVKGAKKVGGFLGGWFKWLLYAAFGILAIFILLKLWQMFG